VATGPSSQTVAISGVGSGIVGGAPTSGTIKLFADKENNCGGVISAVTHQMNGKNSKSGAAIATLRHANTSDNVMVHQRPISKLDGPEHQMMDDDAQISNTAEELSSAAAATDLNQVMASTEQTQCNLGESTL